ncbi:regulator [Algibacter marinivivus]|uniref:Regulator n=1 Tax=Algibacter marinivivus TaxID=2100723 RepID=A0A2U2X7C3_9FLAO|nr:choice-of-anchor B family protein [Algibacter marinivivus]PWH83679.1 regulator [Algibacter marinivivus]
MKFSRPFCAIFLATFFVFTIHSCDDEPVEIIPVVDTDSDGIEDNADNCLSIANPNQEDNDNDGIGDLCDDDDDNDNILDTVDNCPLIANPDQADDDNDGIGNVCDDDTIDPNAPLAVCENGFADIYPCNDYDLMANIPLTTFGAAEGTDCWGWTDSSTGREYALMATSHNTSFVDITKPNEPIYLGNLPTATTSSPWRDVKVYKDHAFIVADCSLGRDPSCNDDHGMQVFDLTRLRNVTNPPETFTADTHFTEFGKAHNIVINEDSGYAYVVGANRSSTYAGGPIFINIQDPKNPVSEGGFLQGGYSHDAQVVTYNGPDADYTGKEILIGSNENEVVIADVTDKANPTIISTISYDNVWYAHQGWFTEDMKYFILGDEVDEIRVGANTRTIVFDFTDLDNPAYHFDYFGNSAAIDHNGYVHNSTYYFASYRAGVRMINISQIAGKSFTEVGFFDTYPANDATEFNGAWNVYPYFASGNIIVSDIDRGLFIIRKSGT